MCEECFISAFIPLGSTKSSVSTLCGLYFTCLVTGAFLLNNNLINRTYTSTKFSSADIEENEQQKNRVSKLKNTKSKKHIEIISGKKPYDSIN